jgi:hypothetical protein
MVLASLLTQHSDHSHMYHVHHDSAYVLCLAIYTSTPHHLDIITTLCKVEAFASWEKAGIPKPGFARSMIAFSHIISNLKGILIMGNY